MIGKATANVVRNTKASRVSLAGTRAFGSESSPSQYQKNLVDPDTRFREYFEKYRQARSVPTIPYSKDAFTSLSDVVKERYSNQRQKVTVVGMGQVGLGCVASVLNQDICGSIAMIDPNEKKLEGEAKDFQQGAAFHASTELLASTEYDISRNSDLVIITAGAAQKPGESRLDLLSKNVGIMESILPNVLEYSPNATILVASNPCDIMTAVASKIAGPRLQPGKIFGTGTALDSSRFQTIIATAMDLDPNSIHGYIIGEHGDSSIPVWSSVRIGALPLIKDDDTVWDETLTAVHKAVVDAAYDVISLKGCTNWAIGMSVAHIAKMVLHDTHSIVPVSTCVRGLYGVEEDVFLSLPCNVCRDGVVATSVLPLTESEQETFRTCAQNIWKVQEPIWDNLGK